jgi:hypothetical protein
VAETERVRQLQNREAPRYDKQMAFMERLLFAAAANGSAGRQTGRSSN